MALILARALRSSPHTPPNLQLIPFAEQRPIRAPGVFFKFHVKNTDKTLLHYKKDVELGGMDKRIQQVVKGVSR